MRNKGASKALAALLRVAILGITQGVATLIAVILFLFGCGVHAIVCVMLAFAVAGLAVGDRVHPAARGEGRGSFPGRHPSRPKRAPDFR
jgi:hypothetical protein